MVKPLFSNKRRQQKQHKRLGTPGLVPKSLLEFKAGRMFREGMTNWVHADLRKGLCYLKKDDDGLLKFCWKDIKANREAEDELILLPGDVRFEKVQQSDERVYVLKLKSSSQRHFFWMQESKDTDDSDIVDSVNVLLNGEQDDGEVFGEGGTEQMGSGMDVGMLLEQPACEDSLTTSDIVDRRASASLLEVESPAPHREQSALAQEDAGDLVHSALPSAQAGRARRSSNSDMVGNISRKDLCSLRQLISSISVPEDYVSSSSAADGSASLRLADVLSPSSLSAVLRNDGVRQSLFPTLPEDILQTESSLAQVIKSPQFQQALDSLSYILESGQIAPLVTQLGLSPEASTSVEAFLQAIEKQVKSQSKKKEDATAKRS